MKFVKKKQKKEVVKMATTKKTISEERLLEKEIKPEQIRESYRGLNIYQKINLARQMFLNSNVKKSGVNRFAKFKYFELDDIVPPATQIGNEIGLVTLFSFNDVACLTVVNTDKPDEKEVFVSPIRPLSIISAEGKNKMNELQGLGSEQTYQRRYLYMMYLDIVENDSVDATIGDDEENIESPATNNRPATVEKRESVKKELINENGKMTQTQLKSIKAGLQQLKDKNEDKYATYIVEIIAKTRAGLTKSEAENLLIEIGNKLNEE